MEWTFFGDQQYLVFMLIEDCRNAASNTELFGVTSFSILRTCLLPIRQPSCKTCTPPRCDKGKM